MRAEFMRRLGGRAAVMWLCVALALITCAILLRVGRGAYADLQGAQGGGVWQRQQVRVNRSPYGARRAVLSVR